MDLSAHHYGVTVTNLDRVVEFYETVLGLDVLDRFSVGGESFSRGVGIRNASAEFVHLDAGETRLELVEYEPTGESGADSRVNSPGTKHVAFSVDDLDAFYESLPDDVPTISDPTTTESGTHILFLRDPEENLVEVLEA